MLPAGIATSGFPRVREVCRAIGIEFDPWQADLNRCLLGKRADGALAADTVGLSIARQVGKTFDIGAVQFAECIAVPRTTVVWTAHQFKVARETFNELRGLAKSKKLMPHLDYDDITTAAGNECIPFRNGSRIVFAARERGAIRGFTKVRRLVLDEAQILTERALADLAPTLNQAVDPQIILMGTPPKPSDPAEVFTRIRSEALDGTSDDVLFVEISADEDADPDDREQWAKANPSYPSRTPERGMLRLRKLLSPEDFRREGLGVWDPPDASRAMAGAWAACAGAPGEMDGGPSVSLDVSLDGSAVSVGIAVKRADGRAQVELVHWGTSVVDAVAEAARLSRSYSVPVTLAPQSAHLEPDIRAAGGRPEVLSAADVAKACGAFRDAVVERTVAHLDDPKLTQAVLSARLRSGESYVFTRKGGVDISPLYAVTLARWAVCSKKDILSAIW